MDWTLIRDRAHVINEVMVTTAMAAESLLDFEISEGMCWHDELLGES